jgi:hypothetical protein
VAAGTHRRSIGFLVAVIVATVLVPFLSPARCSPHRAAPDRGARPAVRLGRAADSQRRLPGTLVLLGIGFIVAVRLLAMEVPHPSDGMAHLQPDDRFLARRLACRGDRRGRGLPRAGLRASDFVQRWSPGGRTVSDRSGS